MNMDCVSWIQSCPIVGGNVKQESLSSLSLLHVKSSPIMFAFSFIRGRHCFGTVPADRVQFTGGVRLPAIHSKLVSIFWHHGFFGSVISLISSALPDIFWYAIFPSLSLSSHPVYLSSCLIKLPSPLLFFLQSCHSSFFLSLILFISQFTFFYFLPSCCAAVINCNIPCLSFGCISSHHKLWIFLRTMCVYFSFLPYK